MPFPLVRIPFSLLFSSAGDFRHFYQNVAGLAVVQLQTVIKVELDAHIGLIFLKAVEGKPFFFLGSQVSELSINGRPMARACGFGSIYFELLNTDCNFAFKWNHIFVAHSC